MKTTRTLYKKAFFKGAGVKHTRSNFFQKKQMFKKCNYLNSSVILSKEY